MKAEIIAVGTELLMGYIVNTNARDISKALLENGIGTYYQQIVGDNAQRIAEVFRQACRRSDLVIVTGGIGPTHDDMTKQVIAEVIGTTLIEDERQLAKLERHFQTLDREMTKIDRRQVLTLKGGESLWNEVGYACGSYIHYQGTDVYLLPGPPTEMNAMLVAELLPHIANRRQTTEYLISHYLHYSGIREAHVAVLLADLIANQTNPTIAIYATPQRITLRLTANVLVEEEGKMLIDELAERINQIIGDYYIGSGEEV